MRITSRDIFIKNIFSSVASRIDFLSSLLSFGLDNVWRRRLVSLVAVENGERVLDVCTGTGKVTTLLSGLAGAQGMVVGVDFCEAMLRVNGRKGGSHPSNVELFLSDARSLPFRSESFDIVTTAFGMRNIRDTIPALEEAWRVLRPGGRYYCLELTTPDRTWFKPIYRFYCFNVVPFIGKVVTGSATPYSYLPRSIAAFPCNDEFMRSMECAGFTGVSAHRMTLGAATIFSAVKRPG